MDKSNKLIVFDMDGVLIDVSGSYREAVRKTARLFLAGAKNFDKLPEPLFSLEELLRLKQTGGLNNDWELTARTIDLLFTLLESPAGSPSSLESPAGSVPSADSVSCKNAIRAYDAQKLADFLHKSSAPLTDLAALQKDGKSPFVEQCFRGDVKTGNIIKRMFQEIYLGPALFRSAYDLEPEFSNDEGLINNESLLVNAAILQDLALRHTLAIATGRPQMEAEHPLKRFAIRKYFRDIITHDDCIREEQRLYREKNIRVSLEKPNPFMLDLLSDRLGNSFDQRFYVGDMPDDMQAAKASKMKYRAIGALFLSSASQNSRDILIKASADHLIDSPASLTVIFG
ncbi:MAG: HAD family hydrolase [Syntrophales bacterium]